jgi:hypothetical protein
VVFIINNNEFNSIKSMEGHVMRAEMIARLLMVLTCFVLAMLGIITFLHSGDHKMLGILISFAGVVSMFGGLPDNA